MTADLASRLLARVRDVPDYPTPGILFRDITPLLADAETFAAAVEGLAAAAGGAVDLVAGVEARGFILGAPVAVALGAGFVPVRKAGRLPRERIGASYSLEYATAEIEIHADAVTAGHRVLVVDDVLATGGTANAACELVERAGGTVVGLAVLLEIAALGGRARLGGRAVHALIVV